MGLFVYVWVGFDRLGVFWGMLRCVGVGWDIWEYDRLSCSMFGYDVAFSLCWGMLGCAGEG